MNETPHKVALSGDRIYTSRDRVNVLSMFRATWSEDGLNNYYRPVNRRRKGETIEDYLRRCVRDMLATHAPGYLPRVTEITIRENYGERGSYHWTAWGEDLPHDTLFRRVNEHGGTVYTVTRAAIIGQSGLNGWVYEYDRKMDGYYVWREHVDGGRRFGHFLYKVA